MAKLYLSDLLKSISLTIANFVSDPPWNGGFFEEEDISHKDAAQKEKEMLLAASLYASKKHITKATVPENPSFTAAPLPQQ